MTLPRRTSYAILAVGLLAAAVVPDAPPGLGLFAVAVALAAILVPHAPPGVWPRVQLGLALALSASVVVRDAQWVVAFDLLGAATLAVLSRVDAVSFAQFARTLLAAVPATCRAPFVLAAPVGAAIRDSQADRIAPMLRGTAVAAALAVVFGTLFATADQAFAALAGDIFTAPAGIDVIVARVVVCVAVIGFAGGLLLLRGEPAAAGPNERTLRRAEWVPALATLVALFGVFVAVQVTVLFGGAEHVLATAGLTYAQYARQGFFQLLAVAALTLGVVAAAVRLVPRDDRVLLRALLGPLCGLTLVVLASAWRRLDLYEDVFGLTRLRVSVEATILWLAVVFVLVLVAGVRMRATWLPRGIVLTAALGLLAFTASNPDARIGRSSGDVAYLRTLSADAAPALGCRPRQLPPRSLAGWNLARWRAEEAAPCAYR